MGPIIFILYVNDLPDGIESSKVSLFADDTKVYKRVDSASDATSLPRDLYSIDSCSGIWPHIQPKEVQVPTDN